MARKAHVLMIDDDVDLIEVNKAVLEANGYRVSVAFNGEEGLEKAKKLHPDVIVLDVMMDYKTEGFHVTYDLRQDPVLKKTPIIMLTAINKEEFIGRFQPDPTWLPVDKLFDKPRAPSACWRRSRRYFPSDGIGALRSFDVESRVRRALLRTRVRLGWPRASASRGREPMVA